MKINGNEIRPGNVIEHDKSLWVAVKTQAVKPGKGPAYNQVELKNLIDGRKLNNRFGSDEKVALLLGAEGPGLTDETMDQVERRVRIPLHGGVDSLNVGAAAAIACYVLGRGRP